jgi:hypothetical protein
MVYEISFRRLKSEIPADVVLRRPFADEVEDYKEYKRQRQIARNTHQQFTSEETRVPILMLPSDATSDEIAFRQDSFDL